MARHNGRSVDSGAKPRIILTWADHERLSSLLNAALDRMPDVAATLAEELERAQVLPEGRCPDDVVCMGREVEFRDDTTGKVMRQVLVYPDAADIERGRISVLTPVGTALIGLSLGQSITWQTRAGELKRLTVLGVRDASAA